MVVMIIVIIPNFISNRLVSVFMSLRRESLNGLVVFVKLKNALIL